MRQAGFEPATDGLEDHCSIQLSYWHLVDPYYYKEPASTRQRLKVMGQTATLGLSIKMK